MTNEITIEKIIREINITNTVLNSFDKTFDLGWTSKWYLGDADVWDLRNYKVVTPRLYEAILAKKEEIMLFKHDYYRQKTVSEISLIIGLPISVICEHMNRKKSNYHNTHFDETITGETLLFNCSCFTILKNIQKEYLAERLELQIKK